MHEDVDTQIIIHKHKCNIVLNELNRYFRGLNPTSSTTKIILLMKTRLEKYEHTGKFIVKIGLTNTIFY